MEQTQRRIWLIKALLKERPEYASIEIPETEAEQKRLLRALFNVRPPHFASEKFLAVQDAYLKEETRRKGITSAGDLVPVSPMHPDLYLWQGDITTLACDAIVNAANDQMLGCFVPNHGCIDNAIHTFAGVQMRMECARIMETKGYDGTVLVTPGFDLPCRNVFHTVGPIIYSKVSRKDEEALEKCYWSCLEKADALHLKNIAFCCISTGEFRFPNDLAARIAVHTVLTYKKHTNSTIEVIFNVFKDKDKQLYENLLGEIR